MSAATKTKKKTRQRTHRYTSNIFSMFNQAQIQEFKESFNMIDQNKDGFIDKDDLYEMLTSLGKDPSDITLDGMVGEAPGPINFTMFLTLFGEKLQGTDPEDVIRNAFACFDEKALGIINEDRLREIMTTMGDRWSDDQVDELFHSTGLTNGFFDYPEFIRTLKYGARDKDDEQRPAQGVPMVVPR